MVRNCEIANYSYTFPVITSKLTFVQIVHSNVNIIHLQVKFFIAKICSRRR